MPCYHPLEAYRLPGGISFDEAHPDAGAKLELPCGRCIGCRIKRSMEWATRCIHEAQMHQVNTFVTLTYDDEHYEPSLNYAHFQKFIRALRKRRPEQIRYFAAGEYGSETKRPHWHALLFGTTFENWQPIGKQLWRSAELESLWTHGQSSIGEVNWTTASYVASYCTAKITGPLAKEHYTRVHLATGALIQVTPEMARMSLKPAIGKTWFDKYWKEVYEARDGTVKPGGHQQKPPRYYDKLLTAKNQKLMCEKETDRILEGAKRQADNTTERLLVREKVTKARINQKRKRL